MSTATTRAFVENLFASIAASGFRETFLDSLSDDVVCTATGSNPLSGRYQGKKTYCENVLGKIHGKLESSPRPKVDRILVDESWACVYFHSTGVRALNGDDFGMEYCWLLNVRDEKIVEVVGFYDGNKMTNLFS